MPRGHFILHQCHALQDGAALRVVGFLSQTCNTSRSFPPATKTRFKHYAAIHRDHINGTWVLLVLQPKSGILRSTFWGRARVTPR